MDDFLTTAAERFKQHGLIADDITSYLIRNDWIQDHNYTGENMRVFENEKQRIAVLSSEKFADFWYHFPSTIEMISKAHKCSVDKVVYGLLWQLFIRRSVEIMKAGGKKGENENN